MVLTNITRHEKIEEWIQVIETVAESLSGVESVIGFLVLVAGIVATGWHTLISICSILSSYNIEVALMTKKERVKMNVTAIAVYIVALLLFNLLWSSMAVAFKPNDGVILAGMLLLFAFVPALAFIIVLLFGMWLIKKLSNIHICRFLGVIVKKCLCRIRTGMSRVYGGVRSICRKIMDKIGSLGFCVGIRNTYANIHDRVVVLWKSCEKKKEHINNLQKLTFKQQLRLSGFTITTVFGIIFNYELAVSSKDTHNVYLLSIMVTIMTIEVALAFLNFQVAPHDSRIFYYDDTWQKNIFIYFRQDEGHCIGGDADILEDCNELFLVPYDKLELQKLYSISKLRLSKNGIDMKKIRLQHGNNELMLEAACDKINKELSGQGIVPELIETADIYIKPDVKKAYYVLENNARGEIDL